MNKAAIKIIKIKKLRDDARLPEYKTSGSSGFDIYALDRIKVLSKDCALISTGLALEVGDGYEVQIRSRSGLANEHKIFVLNSPGTIDSDYRGEIKIILMNLGDKPFIVRKYDRIAQGVVARVYRAEFNEVEALAESKRGKGGIGSTGVNDAKNSGESIEK